MKRNNLIIDIMCQHPKKNCLVFPKEPMFLIITLIHEEVIYNYINFSCIEYFYFSYFKCIFNAANFLVINYF